LKPSILITGGAGLLAVNWAAMVKDRFAVTLGMHKRRISMNGVDSRLIDLNSPSAIAFQLEQINAVLVINTAAITNVDVCELEPQIARHTNVDIAHNVALACKAHGVKLVHISTDHVFGGTHSMLSEAATIDPINVYAQTKADGEAAVLDACPNAIIARTNFFGWGLPYRKSFSDTIIDSLRTGCQISLFSDAYFTPILMELLINAAHELVDEDASGIFHMSGDERVSKYDFGLRIAQTFGLDAGLINPTLLAERRDLTPRPLDLSLDNLKLRNAVGYAIGNVSSQLERLRSQHSRKLNLEIVN
jgi:dTDP-4-dehydrorhamnose reductase